MCFFFIIIIILTYWILLCVDFALRSSLFATLLTIFKYFAVLLFFFFFFLEYTEAVRICGYSYTLNGSLHMRETQRTSQQIQLFEYITLTLIIVHFLQYFEHATVLSIRIGMPQGEVDDLK